MGGSYYDRSVGTSSDGTFSASASTALSQSKLHEDLNPLKREIKCSNKTPIVVSVDVTGSMGDWPRVIWDKLPMFYGQIMMQGYLTDPAISFSANGDFHDAAPLQISDFAQGNDIDGKISKIFLEGGGGGPEASHESYELSAYYYSRHCKIENNSIKPFFFLSPMNIFIK